MFIPPEILVSSFVWPENIPENRGADYLDLAKLFGVCLELCNQMRKIVIF